MGRNRIIVLSAIAVGVIMVLFPPWSVRERMYGGVTAPFAPDESTSYAFIGCPPTRRMGWHDLIPSAVATVDLSRLLLQFVALGLAVGGSLLVATSRRDTDAGGKHTAHPRSQETIDKA